MDLEDLRNDLGSKINQYDESTDSFASGFITTVEANRWINQTFEELYKWYALANKGRFSTKATLATEEDVAIYPFGGDAADLLAIESVFVKINATDDDYTRVYPIDEGSFLQHGSEKVPSNAPRYREIQILNLDTNNYELALEFLEDCVPTDDIDEGILINYISRPPLMTDDAHTPQKLPLELHKYIVIGAAIPAFEKMGEWDSAAYLEGKLANRIKSFFAQEQSTTAQGTKKIKMRRKDAIKFYLRSK